MEVRKLDTLDRPSSTKPDIFVTTTGAGSKGNVMAFDKIYHNSQRKNDDTVVENIGILDNDIRMPVIKDPNHKDIRIEVPDGHDAIVLVKGRLLNLGSATGHPSFVK